MISHELSAVEANSRTSATLAAQIEQFLAAGGRIDVAAPMEAKPLPSRREVEPAPRASKRAPQAAKAPKPVKEMPMTLADRQRAKRAALAPEVRELAKTTNARQIAIRLGIGLTTLRTIGREYDIVFIPAKSSSQVAAENRDRAFAERLRAFLKIGLTKRQACMRSGIGYRAFNRVCKAFNLHFPDPADE
ncbi:hypothetical protein E8E95_05600 [Pseudomonas sp. BN414]|uniref:hypothetical protein n=1 Tax=Pseudomonas sp. BN414 TaxID=2567888 RepID=UPI002455A0F1|nr:hypothetical protein [Pseudomonas sp. BN414]MDH4566147.1 hypothetical protein [Pseudomonas sp. BN414]